MAERRARRDGGFTLLELTLSVSILGIILSALTAATVVVFRNNHVASDTSDASNGSTALTNYFPSDVASTPPGGRELSPGVTPGCAGYSDSGYNIARFTWSEEISGTTHLYRVAYRLVNTPGGGEIRRVACDGASSVDLGGAQLRRVAFGLGAVPSGWSAGMAPASLSPLSGDGPLTLSITTAKGAVYSVQGSSFNPGTHLDPTDPPAPNVQLETTMSLATPNYSSPGQVLTYAVTISNTGAVPVTTVTPTYDNAAAGTACAYLLAPGVTTSCTATHTVTQADLDYGTITASVVATGYYGIYAAGAVATNEVLAAAAPSVSAVLSSATANYNVDNAVIDYSMTVTNTGNITLVGLTEAYTNATAVSACTPTTLSPGSSAICTATHTVTTGEYAGPIDNVASVFGTTARLGDTPMTTTDVYEIPFVPNPAIMVSSLTGSPSPFTTLGDVVTFTAVVGNIGNVDLSSVSVTWGNATSATSCDSDVVHLTTATCTATHTVTQEELDGGYFTGTATVSGTYGSTTVTASSSTPVPAFGRPNISVTLTGDRTTYTTTGTVVTYTLTVLNVGSVTLTDVTPTWTNATASGSCSPIPLAPGSSATCTATHTITSGELGSNISASASAIGSSSTAGDTPTVSSSPYVTTFVPVPTIAVTAFSANPSPFTAIGSTVTFTVSIQNTGNVALSSISLVYANATAATSCPATLAIGATGSCTATHTVTSTDSMAGFSATVQASGTYSSTTTSAQSSLTVPSAVPCTVLSETSAVIASPTTTLLITTNGPNKGYLTDDIVITVNTSALCSGLRIKYSPQSPNSVIADMTMSASGVWTYTIPGQNGTAPATWKTGTKQIQVLPAASVGSTAIYTNSTAFTVT